MKNFSSLFLFFLRKQLETLFETFENRRINRTGEGKLCVLISFMYIFFFFIFHYTQLLLRFGHPTQKSKNELIQRRRKNSNENGRKDQKKNEVKKHNDYLVPLLVILVLCLFVEIRCWLWLLHYMIWRYFELWTIVAYCWWSTPLSWCRYDCCIFGSTVVDATFFSFSWKFE